MKEIILAGVVKQSMTDGPGLRFTIFTQGCPHACKGCHNPETWTYKGGTPYTPEKLMSLVNENPLLKGVTFSGGEPIDQAAALIPFARLIKESGLDLVCYTGYTLEELQEKDDQHINDLLSYVDMLVDGKYKEELRDISMPFVGSSNQRTIDLPTTLKTGEIALFKF